MTDAVTAAPTPMIDETTTEFDVGGQSQTPMAAEPAAGPDGATDETAGEETTTGETGDGEAAADSTGAGDPSGEATGADESGNGESGNGESGNRPTGMAEVGQQPANDTPAGASLAMDGGGSPQQSASTGPGGPAGEAPGLPQTGSVTLPADSGSSAGQNPAAPQGGGANFGTPERSIGAGLKGIGPNAPLGQGSSGPASGPQGRGPAGNPGAQPRGPIDLTETPTEDDTPPIQSPSAPPALPTPVFSLSSLLIEENLRGGAVGAIEVRLPAGRTFAYTVDDDRFEVVDGTLVLKEGVSLDHETEPTADLIISATGSGKIYDTSFRISVTDLNEAPTDIALAASEVDENAAGAVIGALSTTDEDEGDSHAYSVDDLRFEVVDGQLKLKDEISLDHETEATVEVEVTVTDSGELTHSRSFTITVGDLNEAPTALQLSGGNVDGLTGGAVVGTLTTTDEDAGDSHSYSVDDARFEVVDGGLRLKPWAALDPAVESEVDLTVTATDGGGLAHVETFVVEVTPADAGALVVPQGDEVLANAGTDGNQQLRSAFLGGKGAAALADGGYVVTWLSSDDGAENPSIRTQRFTALGQAVGEETIVQPLPGTSGGPSVVTGLADGGHLVAWLQQDGESASIHGRFYDAEGEPSGAAAQLIGVEFWNASWTSIALSGVADGGFVLTWGDWLGHEMQTVGAQRFDAAGETVGGIVQLGWWAETMETAGLVDGGHVIIRTEMGWSTAYVFDDGGQLVHQFNPHSGDYAKISALADGGFVLVQMGWDGGLFAQNYDASGQSIGDAIPVAAGFWTSEYDVAGLSDGGFVVTWQTGNDVFGRVIDAAGDPVGDLFQAHDDGTGTQTRPQVVGLADGTFAIVWDGQGAGDDQGVFSRVFTVGEDQVLVGTAADDVVASGAGNDTLFGMAGNDSLEAGTGDNVLWGGPGADTIRVSATGGIDTLMDFSVEEGDSLDLSMLLNVSDADGQLLQAYLQFTQDDGDTVLLVDTDGQGDFGEPDAVVRFNESDLIGDAAGAAQVIDNLLASGALQVESPPV